MIIRSKILAAALGLVMASGAIGGAFAETATPVVPSTVATTAPAHVAATKTPVTKTPVTKTVTTRIAGKHHRLHVTHRSLQRKMVSHRIVGKTRLAHRLAPTHVAGSRRHIARSRLVGTQKNAMVRTTKTVIR